MNFFNLSLTTLMIYGSSFNMAYPNNSDDFPSPKSEDLSLYSAEIEKNNPDSLFNEPDSIYCMPKQLDEVTITATLYEQSKFDSFRSITTLNSKEITEKNQFSILDALDNKIGIWIEKRTVTNSDPVLRGLSGANILALVNGNSLSTYWGEGGFAGDDMYGKIDGESIERIEIVRGPSSVLYGSNALGGVLNFITKKSPSNYTEKGWIFGGKIKGGFGSASNYLVGRGESWGASPDFKYFVGASTHHSGDMRAGGDVGYITPSGGKDWSVDWNIEKRIGENHFLLFGGQYMNRPEIYKSFRPKQLNKNERLGLSLEYRWLKRTLISDILNINLYYQYKEDQRVWYSDLELQNFEQEGYALWNTYSFDIHAIKSISSNNKIIYGINYHIDLAENPDDEQFTIKTPFGLQMASPKTNWNSTGIYVHDEWRIFEFLTLYTGARFDNFTFTATDDVFYTKPGDPDTTINKAITDPGHYHQGSITGSAAGVFHLGKKVNLSLTWARGFRMFPPSFGIRQLGFGILIPNGLLDPITADMFEISPRFRSKYLDVHFGAYYTIFHNFQQPIPGTYNGEEYFDYNNNGEFDGNERVFTNAPNGDAFVTGIDFEFDYSLEALSMKLKPFLLSGGMMYNYGRMKFPEIDEVPLRHTHPLRILAKIRYEHSSGKIKKWFEFVSEFVGKYDQIEESRLLSDPGYLENPQDPQSGLYRDYGLPQFIVLNCRGGIKFKNNIIITLALENILDVRYRRAHSRMDGSGRNFLIGLEFILP